MYYNSIMNKVYVLLCICCCCIIVISGIAVFIYYSYQNTEENKEEKKEEINKKILISTQDIVSFQSINTELQPNNKHIVCDITGQRICKLGETNKLFKIYKLNSDGSLNTTDGLNDKDRIMIRLIEDKNKEIDYFWNATSDWKSNLNAYKDCLTKDNINKPPNGCWGQYYYIRKKTGGKIYDGDIIAIQYGNSEIKSLDNTFLKCSDTCVGSQSMKTDMLNDKDNYQLLFMIQRI